MLLLPNVCFRTTSMSLRAVFSQTVMFRERVLQMVLMQVSIAGLRRTSLALRALPLRATILMFLQAVLSFWVFLETVLQTVPALIQAVPMVQMFLLSLLSLFVQQAVLMQATFIISMFFQAMLRFLFFQATPMFRMVFVAKLSFSVLLQAPPALLMVLHVLLEPMANFRVHIMPVLRTALALLFHALLIVWMFLRPVFGSLVFQAAFMFWILLRSMLSRVMSSQAVLQTMFRTLAFLQVFFQMAMRFMLLLVVFTSPMTA